MTGISRDEEHPDIVPVGMEEVLVLCAVITPSLCKQAGKKPKNHPTLKGLKTRLYNMSESLQGTAVRRAKLTCGQMQGLDYIILFQSQGREPHAFDAFVLSSCVFEHVGPDS